MRPRAALGWLLILALGCAKATPTTPARRPAGARLVVAVVPKATTFEFWKSVHAGAARAAAELGVDLIWKGPLNEADPEAQINVVQDLITRRVDGICLAPVDSQALVSVVREANAEGIPTVVYDSGLDATPADIVSTVSTDNRAGGALAARHLGKVLGEKGRVVVLRFSPGSQSTRVREEGFLATLRAEFPGVEVISETEYAGNSAESALDKSQQLFEKFGDRIDGVFTPCEHVTAGMLRALEERGATDKVKHVGFDSSPRLVRALRDRKIDGLVLQDPVRMGDLAVRALVSHLRGQKVLGTIPTGETLATPDNLRVPEVDVLLFPERIEP